MSDRRREDEGEATQAPREEQEPRGDVRVGTDEWVASVEGRTLLRGGPLGGLERAVLSVPPAGRLLVVLAAAGAFGLVTDSDYLLRVGINAILFALLALGLNVVVGWAGLLDLGYIAFYGFGAYAYALLSSSQFDVHLPTIAAIPVVIVASALLGLLLGLPSWRLLGDYLAIVTLFFAQIFLVVATNGNRIGGRDITGGPNGIPGVDAFSLFGVEATAVRSYFFIALAIFAVVIVALALLDDSRTGRAWKALREDPLAAEAMTIPVNRLKLLAFSIGAATAGLTGSIFAAVQIGVFPQNFELPLLITIYAMVILGGAGSLAGVVIGAVTITTVLELLRSPDDSRIVFYGVVIATALAVIRPLWKLAAFVAGTIAFGVVVHLVVGAVSDRWTARPPAAGGGWFSDLVGRWVLLPRDPGDLANGAFVLLVVAVLGLTLLRGWPRLLALGPTIYLAAFVWENKLVFQPSVTRLLLLGALLVALMNIRPQGLLGTARVEIV